MTTIKGIGRRFSNLICKKAEVDSNKRAGELTQVRYGSCPHTPRRRGGRGRAEQAVGAGCRGGLRRALQGAQGACLASVAVGMSCGRVVARFDLRTSRYYLRDACVLMVRHTACRMRSIVCCG